MTEKRHDWIDYARGIAILLVLYRHAFEGIKNSGIPVTPYASIEHANIIFFSFRMPLFFLISGMFVAHSLAKRGLQEFIVVKAKTILYPYFLWGILQLTLQLIFSSYVNAQRTPADYLLLLYQPRGVEQFWYLYALFNVSVLYSIGKYFLYLKPIHNLGIGIIFYFITAKIGQQQLNIGFIADVMHYYLFYAIGDFSAKFIRDDKMLHYLKSWKVMLILLFPFLGAQFYFLQENIHHLSVHYDYVEYFQPIQFLGIALIGCLFIICVSFCLQKWNLFKWLKNLGKHSLYIYVAHVIVLGATRALMVRVFNIQDVPSLLIAGILMGLTVPVLLYKLCVIFNMRWLFVLESKKIQPLTNKTMGSNEA